MHIKRFFLMLKFLKAFSMIFIISNVFFLDYTIYSQNKLTSTKESTIPVSNFFIEKQTIQKTQGQVKILETKVGNIEKNLSITPSTNSYINRQSQQANGVREFYIPFGSGNAQSTDWTDIPGLQTSIDSTLYPRIQKVTFEVGGHTPNGNQIVYIRLFNMTGAHPVWNSDITWNGGGSQYIISNPIVLDSGNTMYKVQMKTQVGSQSFVDQAKIHIVLY